VITDLPPFCDVIVKVAGERHVTTVRIWVPLLWNGRFLGVGGGGNRLMTSLMLPDWIRASTLPTAIRNGFAVANTDGGNQDTRFVEWGLIEATGEIDWELTENWVHRSTHEMTIIGKAVTEAIRGEPPRFSYFVGTSGGGRQGLVEAQRYPDDYDGIWSSDPAINWTTFIPGALWPALVMEKLGAVHPAKFDVFRAAAIAACDNMDGLSDGIVGAYDRCQFDPRRVIGEPTDAGPITATDAEVVARIWEGPRRAATGEFLWYGVRPDIETWGSSAMGVGICMTQKVDGVLRPQAFGICDGFLRAWVVRDPAWTWQSMSFEDYERLFDRSVNELASLASDDPDLRAFGAAGGKLLLSHGAADQLIMSQGTVNYYRRVVDAVGSLDATRQFARFFYSDGDGHSSPVEGGWGVMLAEGMTALMNWVENGEVPDALMARSIDYETGTVSGGRPVFAYPCATRYRGAGDPGQHSSYEAAEVSEEVLSEIA
jgi:Tannase and feruloyl esterase